MFRVRLHSRARRRQPARVPLSGGTLLALIVFLSASAVAIGYATHSSPGSSSSYYDDFTAVDWMSPNGTAIATSSGANVSQGATFATSVVIACPAGLTACSGTAVVSARGAESLGSWPPGVSPCGYMRFTSNITASNLPLNLAPGTTATIAMTLQAPVATYPNSSSLPVQYDYTGWVEVTLTFAP